jgi:hypothetical protein
LDVIPKHRYTQLDLLDEEDRAKILEDEKPSMLNLHEILIAEIVEHLKSDQFYQEFAPFVNNNDTHIKLFCMHIFMITHSFVNGNYVSDEKALEKFNNEQLILSLAKLPFMKKSQILYQIRKSTFMMNSCLYSTAFLSYLYHQFHSHLPEELFFYDFKRFFAGNFNKINKKMQKVVKKYKEDGDETKIHKFILNNIISKEDFEGRY